MRWKGSRDEMIGQAEQDSFVKLIVAQSEIPSKAFINSLLDRGVKSETIFIDLLTAAAHQLGRLWEDDTYDFTDVTIGLCRLHDHLRKYSKSYQIGYPEAIDAPTILIATTNNDQHIFGVAIVAEFFRQSQWRVVCAPASDEGEICEMLRESHVDVLGLSLTGGTPQGQLKEEVKAFRAASKNPVLQVIVGGHEVFKKPDLPDNIGADGWSTNAAEAPSMAGKLIAARQKHVI